jgi:hypothetical protein
MTVNITIEGNHAYCDRAGLAQRLKVECYCTDRD